VPETWDELIALSDQIVADGGTPWCLGNEDGDFTGWVGTDWVEDILLRTAPPEIYDAWVNHDLPFNSSEIQRVFEIMGRIWLNEDYVYGGTANISLESFIDSTTHLLRIRLGAICINKHLSHLIFSRTQSVMNRIMTSSICRPSTLNTANLCLAADTFLPCSTIGLKFGKRCAI
jgi:hypothetical protein